MKRTWRFIIFQSIFLSMLLHGSISSLPFFAQGSPCDPQLKSAGNNPHGYRLRGDRCEGIYIKEVASTTLLVASFVEFVEDFDPISNQPLSMEWAAPGNADVHLRTLALKRNVYYRMDTSRPSGSTSYTWQPNLLAALQLKRSDLGFIAWTSYKAGGKNREVYVPLRVRQNAGITRSTTYKVVLLPGEELAEVFISLTLIDNDGHPEKDLKKDEALGYAYYPSNTRITITIPELKTAGIYHLDIGATLKSGGSHSVQVWFYHPGR